MLDNIEQNDDIHMTDLPQSRRVGHSCQNVQAGAAAVVGGVSGQLDPGHVEMARGLLQEKAVGASELQELPAVAVATDEFDAAREFAPQHGLGAEVIRIAVGAAAGEIILGVIGGGIESGG